MLVLTRRPGEQIVIDDNIVVTITELRGDNVRIAIEAPKTIKIYRGEIYKAIAEENLKAASQDKDLSQFEIIRKNMKQKEKGSNSEINQ